MPTSGIMAVPDVFIFENRSNVNNRSGLYFIPGQRNQHETIYMITILLDKIREELKDVFDKTDAWFDANNKLLQYTPSGGGWSIAKVLEHVSLTNFYLLILIRKGVKKAMDLIKTAELETALANYSFDWSQMSDIGNPNSFKWARPQHMEPTGKIEMPEVRDKIRNQLMECLEYMNKLKNGEGVLYKTTMTVHGLGKIDVYQYIYFLAQHAKRHLKQMEKIKEEFELNQKL